MHVRLSREQEIKVLNGHSVYEVMQQILLRENDIRRSQEHFWVVGLNNTNNILFVELVSLGAGNRVTVAPPEVFRMAIYKLSNKVILVHNHPSGDLRISSSDKAFTALMLAAGKLINIDVLDHLIITESEFVSFVDEGVMEELKHHEKVIFAEKEKALLKEMEADVRRERDLLIAKRMKENGYNGTEIAKLIGLSTEEIKKL